ncbi:hypothetical protein B0H13DRAFT_2316757 [Mycena leptocephala]|nr:hypothetical protein B0H13DRAFT_2316757 [Mycena leptocephala]
MPSPMLKPSAAIHHSADFLCTLIETEIAHAVQPYQNALASVKALASLDAVVKGFATDPTTYKPISPASIVEVLAQCISRMEAGDWNGTCACVAKYPRDAQSALRDTTAARSSAPYDLKYWGMKASASDRQPRVQNAIKVQKYVVRWGGQVADSEASSRGWDADEVVPGQPAALLRGEAPHAGAPHTQLPSSRNSCSIDWLARCVRCPQFEYSAASGYMARGVRISTSSPAKLHAPSV